MRFNKVITYLKYWLLLLSILRKITIDFIITVINRIFNALLCTINHKL